MMQSKSKHIIIGWILLSIFSFACISKASHFHKEESGHHHCNNLSGIEKLSDEIVDESCSICDFYFYPQELLSNQLETNFSSTENEYIYPYLENVLSLSKEKISPRAPPIS